MCSIPCLFQFGSPFIPRINHRYVYIPLLVQVFNYSKIDCCIKYSIFKLIMPVWWPIVVIQNIVKKNIYKLKQIKNKSNIKYYENENKIFSALK